MLLLLKSSNHPLSHRSRIYRGCLCVYSMDSMALSSLLTPFYIPNHYPCTLNTTPPPPTHICKLLIDVIGEINLALLISLVHSFLYNLVWMCDKFIAPFWFLCCSIFSISVRRHHHRRRRRRCCWWCSCCCCISCTHSHLSHGCFYTNSESSIITASAVKTGRRRQRTRK